jgi:hypothetical protein
VLGKAAAHGALAAVVDFSVPSLKKGTTTGPSLTIAPLAKPRDERTAASPPTISFLGWLI